MSRNRISQLKKLNYSLIFLSYLLLSACSSNDGATEKNPSQTIKPVDRLDQPSMTLPYGKNLDVCTCNKKAQKIIDNVISIRSNFDSISDLKRDKGTVKEVRSEAEKYQSLIAKCFKANAVNMFEESDCNDLKTLEEKKNLLFSMGIQIEQGANIRL